MSREEIYHLLKMVGSGLASAIVYMSSHNFKQTPAPPSIVPQDIMLYLEAFATALGGMGLYLAHSPLDIPAKPAPAPQEDTPQKEIVT